MKNTLALVLFLFFAGSAFALQATPEASKASVIKKIVGDFYLNDQQQSELLEQKHEVEKKVLELKLKNNRLNAQIRDEMKKENPNLPNIHNWIKEMSGNQAQIQIEKVDFQIMKRSMLTDEQKKKYKALFYGTFDEEVE